MTLWLRLLLATVGVVAAGLLVSGVITWVLVGQLVRENARAQLNENLLTYRNLVVQAACQQTRADGSGCAVPVRDESLFLDTIDTELGAQPLPAGERLLLIDRRGVPAVLFDSDHSLDRFTQVRVRPQGYQLVSRIRVGHGDIALGGRPYLYSATAMSNRFKVWLVLARPTAQVTAQTTGNLVPLLAGAGGAGLLVAVVVTLLLARMLSRPLNELTDAAGDIAGGNYARRVRERGPSEVGVLARAFNGMAEAVERSRRQQREFLADVSHELKTPLTSLIGFSGAMADGSLRTDEQRARAITIVNEESRRVLRLAQELLDLARVEAGHVTYHLQPVDLGAQLEQEVEVVRPRAEQRRLTLAVRTPAPLPPVLADPERLHQVLGNLMDNAVKYAPEGDTVEIVAETHPHWIVTEVRNRVAGHRPDPERMFDRFYRADPSRASAGGAGLGLAIGSELAAAQGGQLTAYVRGDRIHVRLTMPAAAAIPSIGSQSTA
jgi:signal transduction histidine kinase